MKCKPFAFGVLAVLVIGVLEAVALFQGMNGITLSASVGAISAVSGWTLKSLTVKHKGS